MIEVCSDQMSYSNDSNVCMLALHVANREKDREREEVENDSYPIGRWIYFTSLQIASRVSWSGFVFPTVCTWQIQSEPGNGKSALLGK